MYPDILLGMFPVAHMRTERPTRVRLGTNLSKDVQEYVGGDDKRGDAGKEHETQTQALAEAEANEAIRDEHEKKRAQRDLADGSQRLAPSAPRQARPKSLPWHGPDVLNELHEGVTK